MHLGQSPDLVGVASSARPDLHNGTVIERAVGQVEAETYRAQPSQYFCYRTQCNVRTLVLEGNTVIGGVVPGLGSEAGVALPDLHASAVSGACGKVISEGR